MNSSMDVMAPILAMVWASDDLNNGDGRCSCDGAGEQAFTPNYAFDFVDKFTCNGLHPSTCNVNIIIQSNINKDTPCVH